MTIKEALSYLYEQASERNNIDVMVKCAEIWDALTLPAADGLRETPPWLQPPSQKFREAVNKVGGYLRDAPKLHAAIVREREAKVHARAKEMHEKGATTDQIKRYLAGRREYIEKGWGGP